MDDRMVSMKGSRLVWDRWAYFAKERPEAEAIVHWDALGEPFRWTYGNLLGEALKIASGLIRKDIKTGDVCALIMRHNRFFYPAYMAIAAIGAIPAVIAYPNERLHSDKFVHGLSGMAKKSGLDWILTEEALGPVIEPLIKSEHSTIKDILYPLKWAEGPERENDGYGSHRKAIEDASPFLLQHSSGTTGLQKAVVLSHRAILEHVDIYAKSIRLSGRDKVVSWLPLYHDMGLVTSFHMPLACGIPSIHIDPFQWVSAPSIFFQAISREKATLAWLPNFAYNLMADRISEEDMEGMDLSSMRMFINCSEVVRAKSHARFFARFHKYGVKKETLSACYAMAETTFAVTGTSPGAGAGTLAVDRNALAGKIIKPPKDGASEKIFVSSGLPIPGSALKIVDESGGELGEDMIGVIAIKSVSMFDGYRNDPERTASVLRDGWYHSGDYGFCHKGEYFVIGRADDVIIVAGRNIFPEDIEDAVSHINGVIPGRVVAFGAENPDTGTEDVYVIAETRHKDEGKKSELELAIRRAAMDIDVTVSRVCLVPPRWLIKSSSGKLSRGTNKKRILSSAAKDPETA